MVKLNAKFDADLLFYSISYFDCDGSTVHMLTQQHLLPPVTSTVKLSLFTHVHSSPFSLAARLHRHHANNSCCINNCWTLSGQTSCFQIKFHLLACFFFKFILLAIRIVSNYAVIIKQFSKHLQN